MSILYSEQEKVVTLHTASTTYQMKIDKYQRLLHLYYGVRIDDMDLSYYLQYSDRAFSGNIAEARYNRTYSLDVLPQEFPTYGMSDFRIPAIVVQYEDGSYALDLVYHSHKIYPGKYLLDGLPHAYEARDEVVDSLEIVLIDPVTKLEVTLLYSTFEKADVITRAVKVTNNGSQKVSLQKVMSASLDTVNREYDLIHFHGRHNMERQFERVRLSHQTAQFGSRRGTSSHQHNPFFILAEKETTESAGACFGMMLVYSGDFQATTELSQFETVRTQLGLGSEGFNYVLEASETFTAPEVLLSYSSKGLTTLTHQFHHLIRHHIVRGKYQYKRRPILVNNWEATYFDFDENKLLALADEAVDLGIEMLVMDDGWFGKRDNDQTSLGDWFVNQEKLPNGLNHLVTQIHDKGLKFGIWFEPEMISEKSDLFKQHPEWHIHVPNRESVTSRHQYVLDLTRSDVRAYLYQVVSDILKKAPINYVKWDMNRSITNNYSLKLSPEEQGKFNYLYVKGLYELLERLTTDFPDVLFESCSGGGGRFDAGMLYYTPQIWTSDNTDAIERLTIQHGTSFGYPLSTQGAHVSAVPNHQTGRVTPLDTRAVVAYSGIFGYELDLTKLSIDEKEKIKEQTAFVKQHYDLLTNGTYYRLISPETQAGYVIWQLVSEERDESLLFIVKNKAQANTPFKMVRLNGLLEDNEYQVETYEKIITGRALMTQGLPIVETYRDYDATVLYIQKTTC